MKKILAHTVWECKYHIVWVAKNKGMVLQSTRRFVSAEQYGIYKGRNKTLKDEKRRMGKDFQY